VVIGFGTLSAQNSNMKKVFIGLEGAGKDLHFARLIQSCVNRNIRWRKKYGFTRGIATSMPLSEEFKGWLAKRQIPLYLVTKQSDISKLNGCDLFISELAVFFDARGWENMPHSLRLWLSQQSKRGVHLYGACQNWEQIDVSFRRLVPEGNIFEIQKMLGSARPGKNLPPVKSIWGIYWVFNISINEEKKEKKRSFLFPPPIPYFIEKEFTGAFDTNATIQAEKDDLEHFVRKCNVCGYTKVIHQ